MSGSPAPLNTMGLFFSQSKYLSEPVPQGLNEWINYPDTDPRMPGLFAARATIEPGYGHDFHRHPGREEIIYILQGTIAQWIEQDRQVLYAGDSALIPAGLVHASFNVGDGPAVLLVVLSEAQSVEPLAIDVAGEEPWRSLPTP